MTSFSNAGLIRGRSENVRVGRGDRGLAESISICANRGPSSHLYQTEIRS